MASVNSTQSVNNHTYTKKLTKWCKDKIIIEIIAFGREVTGTLTEVGDDYISIVGSIEKTEENISKGQDGKKEKNIHIAVFEVETLLKRSDIESISRVLKKRYK